MGALYLGRIEAKKFENYRSSRYPAVRLSGGANSVTLWACGGRGISLTHMAAGDKDRQEFFWTDETIYPQLMEARDAGNREGRQVVGWDKNGGGTTGHVAPQKDWGDYPSFHNLNLGKFRIIRISDSHVVMISDPDPESGIRMERSFVFSPLAPEADSGTVLTTSLVIENISHQVDRKKFGGVVTLDKSGWEVTRIATPVIVTLNNVLGLPVPFVHPAFLKPAEAMKHVNSLGNGVFELLANLHGEMPAGEMLKIGVEYVDKSLFSPPNMVFTFPGKPTMLGIDTPYYYGNPAEGHHQGEGFLQSDLFEAEHVGQAEELPPGGRSRPLITTFSVQRVKVEK